MIFGNIYFFILMVSAFEGSLLYCFGAGDLIFINRRELEVVILGKEVLLLLFYEYRGGGVPLAIFAA